MVQLTSRMQSSPSRTGALAEEAALPSTTLVDPACNANGDSPSSRLSADGALPPPPPPRGCECGWLASRSRVYSVCKQPPGYVAGRLTLDLGA